MSPAALYTGCSLRDGGLCSPVCKPTPGHAHTGPQENGIQVCVLQQSADHTGLSAAVLQGTNEWDA